MPRERVQHGDIYVFAKTPDESDPVLPGQTPAAGKKYYPGDVVPDDHILREEPSLDVSWRNEDVGGWVQICFDAPRDWWERFIAAFDESPEQHHFAAFTSVLTRGQINHLIKSLRRARDRAYGADQ